MSRRIPFQVTIYGSEVNTPQVVTVWLEVPEPVGLDGWDAVMADERFAEEDIKANMEVSIDTEALIAQSRLPSPRQEGS